ncbi:MAG: outer membrane beta-barrel protein [Gemmatimonadales bacterium]
MSTGTPLIRRVLLAGGVCLAGLAPPAVVAAQAKLELTPFFTSYYPLTTLTDDFASSFFGPGVSLKQQSAAGLGARLTYWVSPTLAIEAAGSHIWSTPRIFSADTINLGSTLSGRIVTASVRALYRPARTNLFLMGGVGMVNRGGEIWEDIDQPTAFGGVLGFGVRASVTPKLALYVSAEAYLYSTDPDGSDFDDFPESKFQQDIVVSIGVPIALMR